MVKLFFELNGKLWWRSLRSVEVSAIILYSLFLLLIFGQFVGVAFTLVFVSDHATVQQEYPWFTRDVQFLVHLVFINLVWFSQLFYTKISRLRLNDNRKLLALGMPLQKLINYMNIAGFLHPVNLMFNIFWFVYLGLMATTVYQAVMVSVLIVLNYGLINAIKWRFKTFTSENSKWLNGLLGLIVMILILFATQIDLTNFVAYPEFFAPKINEWLVYSPGMIFYSAAAWIPGELVFLVVFITVMICGFVLQKDLYLQTRKALLTPLASDSSEDHSNGIRFFIKWLGRQGGKFFYSVWKHPFSKTQILLTYFFVIPYIVFVSTGTENGGFMTSVLLSLIPVIFLMVMMANMFGFENRELLLTLQAPIKREKIIIERFFTAFKITLVGLISVLVFIPFLYQSPLTMVQVFMGVLFITMVFSHYVFKSSMNNYKKIEDVSLMSVSNPVVPASVNFSGMFIVLLLGVVTFPVYENVQWYHIAALGVGNVILLIMYIKKLKGVSISFNKKVIPHLWNEL
ncbi:hypothetical protein [Rhodohalobacter barkolensis]|uniref:Uncharacterized protein n=1 Tax=Rhodohalobacter barkolensis TaxID=2053187 RepID=A0A2N0VGC0_9BACT|nr:hypothetical protein [Rhodohalobacter barkolensis]PKD43198.1 hypothetical protein CWD77_11315 [Rhodohalobacter barkolensis]